MNVIICAPLPILFGS